MKRTIISGLLVVLALASIVAADDKKATVLFQAAQARETIQGDLKGAIALYQDVVKEAGGNRAIAARALVRMAECYQKLGDAQARKIFEQLVRDYADQKDAATLARERLANTPAAADQRIVTRQLWSVPSEALGERTPDGLGTVSPDGRYFSFVDWSSGELFLHNFTTGENRRLTNDARKAQYAEESVISRDGAHVAYAWFNTDGYELRTLDVNAKGAAPRVLFANHREDPLVFPYDWSPDGKWIVVQIRRADGTGQLALVSTVDGALRVLESSDWRRASGIAFSPDGKFLAYDIAADSVPEQHDIYIIAADAHQKIAAVVDPANDMVIGWAPDGGHLLFSSDRSGTHGIWALAVADGKRQGEPRLIKADVRVKPRGITRSGALYFSTALSHRDIYVASVDFETGKLLAAPARIAGQTVGFNVAAQWSPDGESLAYLPRSKDASTVAIQSIATGRVRELRPNLAYVFDEPPLWSPDGSFLVVVGPDQKGRWGIHRVEARTGDTTLLAMSDPPAKNAVHPIAWSSNGQTLYIRRAVTGSASETVAFDMRTRHEEPIRRVTAGFVPSPDGGAWATLEKSSSGTSLRIEPAGGPVRTPLQVNAPEDLSGFGGQGPRWSPDSRFVVVRGSQEDVWAIPADGGSPRKLDLGHLKPANLQIHPDGHRVAIETAEQKVEIWMLENFFPTVTGKK
jgi:Tol biopolymer transport system component